MEENLSLILQTEENVAFSFKKKEHFLLSASSFFSPDLYAHLCMGGIGKKYIPKQIFVLRSANPGFECMKIKMSFLDILLGLMPLWFVCCKY